MTQNRLAIRVSMACILFACLFAASRANALGPILNPKTYASPSGEYALTVEPSTMYGQGEATYRITRRGGAVVWTAKHPFTLWQAVITDDGTAGGYGYQYGPQGFPPRDQKGNDDDDDDRPGKFHVAIFPPDGTLRLNQAVNRELSRFLHDAPNPLANGLLLDDAQRRMVLRVRDPDINAGGERWWIYDLSAGKELAKVDPGVKDKGFRFILRAVPVRQTPLVLLHWWHYDDAAKTNPGGGFTLIDLTDPAKPKAVWSKVLPGDYHAENTPDNPYRSDRLMDEIQEQGAIVRCDQPRRFELRFVAENQRVSFEVAGADNAWQVRETARAAYEPPAPAPPPVKFAEKPVALKHVGTLVLRGDKPGAAPNPVRDVRDFDIDDQGRIGLLRGGAEGCSLVLVDAEGKELVAGVRPANNFGDKERTDVKVAWLRGGRWVVTDCEFGIDKNARAWFVDLDDAKAQRVTAIDGYDASGAEAIAGRSDGGFVVISKRHQKYTITEELICFDAKGKRAWSIGANSGDEKMIFGAEDVAVDRAYGDAVILLENAGGRVKFYDANGKFTRHIELKTALGGEAYPTDVRVQRDGTLVVRDFHGSPSIWRLRRDGRALDKFEPRFKEGGKADLHAMRMAPDDHVWMTDGDLLVRLEPGGIIGRTLGTPPDPEAPERFGAIALGLEGAIYTASSRGGTVQVYDAATGKLKAVMKTAPKDFSSAFGTRELTVAGDGSVYLSGDLLDHAYVHFKPDGTRVGRETLGLDTIHETWHFLPGTKRRWVVGYTTLWLVGEDGKPVREIHKQPDGNWLAHPMALGVAPDGSAAVVATDDPIHRSRDGKGARLNVYAADGSPIKTVPLGIDSLFHAVAFDGRRAVVSPLGGTLILVDIEAGTLAALNVPAHDDGPPQEHGPYWHALFSPHGHELWLLDGARKRAGIERFEIPQAK